MDLTRLGPVYKNGIFESKEEKDNAELIINLLNYSKLLEEMIIDLRKEVNRLTPKGHPIPYFELHSDIYEAFDDHPAYEKYREYIELFFQY